MSVTHPVITAPLSRATVGNQCSDQQTEPGFKINNVHADSVRRAHATSEEDEPRITRINADLNPRLSA